MARGHPNQTNICELCGCEYQPTRYRQRWCAACRPEAHRKLRRDYMRRAQRDPIQGPILRERRQRWGQENPEKLKAAQDKCYRRPCPQCGKVRRVGVRGKGGKAAALCAVCSGLARRKMIDLRCRWCEMLFTRWVKGYQAGRSHSCPECRGILTRVGVNLGVSRERVRQLLYREYRRLRYEGHDVTLAEALAVVVERRKAECTT